MDMLNVAMEQEIQIEQYYRQLALISRRPAVKQVLLNMAEVEHTHVMALQEFEASGTVSITPHDYLDFSDWIKVLETNPSPMAEDTLELYEAARNVKWQEEQFYVTAAEQTEIPLEKMLFSGLRKDEIKGAAVIDRLCHSMYRDVSSELTSV